MQRMQLKASARDAKANGLNKLRKQGMLPAVLYGHNVQNQSLSVNANEFEKVLRKAGESTIIDLVTDEGKNHPVLIHDVQIHPLHSTPQHVDFYQVSMTVKLKAHVALEYVGESNAVKAMGGVLVRVLNEVEVECLPADLPHNLEVDISALSTFEDVIYIRNIKVSDKVKILSEADEVVAKVQPPRDVEKEMESQLGDVSQVEGAAEEAPVAEGQAPAEPAAEEKAE